MKKVALVLALCFIASAARASPVAYVPGTGPPNVLPAGRDVIWSEPPDLNGLIASSEQILAFGMETEVANDFVYNESFSFSVVTWWGGYFNNSTPCASGMTTPGFNLRFYEDAGCVPGTTIADLSVTEFREESVGCQAGTYPLFKWSTFACADVIAGNLYWFSAQMKDHSFPPQGGRLASAGVVGCDTVLRSAYFAYPDWTPGIDVFGVAFDASQQLEGVCIDPGDPTGACCFADQGDCQILTYDECLVHGGQYQGDDTACGPVNPCLPTPTKSTTWGQIKGSYR